MRDCEMLVVARRCVYVLVGVLYVQHFTVIPKRQRHHLPFSSSPMYHIRCLRLTSSFALLHIRIRCWELRDGLACDRFTCTTRYSFP